MTPRRIACALSGLGVGLLFYLAHRSDQTVSNRLVSHLCGTSLYTSLKQDIRHWISLPPFLQGCLPSALWCFIVTSLVGGWKIRIQRRRVLPLAWVCPLVNAGWEAVQWLGWTDGHADALDVIAGFVGWIAARVLFARSPKPVEEIPLVWSWRLGVIMSSFGCMGLADVWK